MGILITLALLLALLSLFLLTTGRESTMLGSTAGRRATGLISVIAGLWNTIWYGLQHYSEFWGVVALCSGVSLLAAAGFLLTNASKRSLQFLLCAVLLGFFLLYAITIVQLNLGLPILA